MALVLADRVRDTTTTTGTGTVTLSGTAPTGYQNFSVVGDGNTTYYTINAGSEWETGIGTYSSTGPTLARTTVLASSNSGSLVNFSAGTKDVFVTYPAEKSVNYDASNNVGIGDTAPAYKLTVAGDMRLTGGGDVRLSSATGTTTAGGDSMIYNDANNMIFTTGTTTAERMRITSGGSVGIGTSNPTSLLDVNGNAEVNGTLFLGSSNHGNLASDSNTLYARGTNIAFQDAAGSGTYAYISSSGDLGIGTSSPGGKLDVAGVFKVQGNGDVYGASGNAGAIFLCGGSAYNAGGGVKLYGSSGGDAVAFYTGAFSERMRINSSGNLGVGTSSPSTRFNVKGGTTWLQNFDGSASSPTETVDWPVPALNVTSFGDFTLQTMMTFTLPNDGNYFTGDTVWNIRLEQTASSITSSSSTGFRLMGPGYLAFGSGQQERLRFSTSGGITSSDLADAVGYKGLPQNQRTSAYTLALSDMGKHIYATAANFNITIPANSSVAFPIGTAITIVVEDQFHTLVPAAGVTLVLAGTGAGTTGTRTLAQGSVSTIIKVGTDRWYISGSGVT